MQLLPQNKVIALTITAVMVAVIGGYLLFWAGDTLIEPSLLNQTATTSPATTTPTMDTSTSQVIGRSVEGRAIEAITYGDGEIHLLFVGGIHGGYEWNSVLLAYRLMDYLAGNPEAVPANVAVSVIPTANPDGVYDVIGQEGRFTRADVPADEGPLGTGRFNANDVDLNRNFACRWQPTSTWRARKVSAGTSAFSEPEARAIRDYVQTIQPTAGVFFHSAAGAVYGAACDGTIGPATTKLLNTYAQASGYRAVPLFSAYPITGDVESWLTKLNIPAVSVEMTNHTDVEWTKNLAGIKAMLNFYSQI
jgi:predicted deacylase